MKRTLLLLTVLGALLAGCSATMGSNITCQYTQELSASVPADNAKALRVEALAGSLEIQGKEGLTEVRIKGTACSNDSKLLGEIQISTGVRGGEVQVEAHLPTIQGLSFGRSASLGLVIEAPASWLVKVNDDSGAAVIAGVAAVELTDGSGDIDIRDVAGDVNVRDDSGDLRIQNVGGKVVLQDGSGDIRVTGAREVTVDVDDSGSIDVDQVKGDFTVRRDGSGNITHGKVGGQISVPKDK